MTEIDTFDGEFSFLPFEATVRYGAVPTYPIDGDFELAESVLCRELTLASVWRREAVRWRRSAHGYGKPLDLRAIAVATADVMYTMRDK